MAGQFKFKPFSAACKLVIPALFELFGDPYAKQLEANVALDALLGAAHTLSGGLVLVQRCILGFLVPVQFLCRSLLRRRS